MTTLELCIVICIIISLYLTYKILKSIFRHIFKRKIITNCGRYANIIDCVDYPNCNDCPYKIDKV